MEELSFQDFHQYLLGQNGRIMHSSWFGLIPTKRAARKAYESLKKYRDTWLIKNPNWLHITWNYQRSRDLIKYLYPQHLALFDGYPHHIQRSDISRYFILHAYGGLYKDADYVCVKSWDQVINDFPGDLYLVETPNRMTEQVHISNSLMYTRTRGHPFWTSVFVELEKTKDPPGYYGRHMQIMVSTGPIMLNHVYHATRMRNRLNHYPFAQFHPGGLDVEGYTTDRTNIYAYHHGKGSWEGTDSKILILIYQEWKILAVIILGLIVPGLIYWFLNRKKHVN